MKTIIFVGGGLLLLAPAVVAGTIFADAMRQRAEVANGARLRVLGEIAAEQLGRNMHQLWQAVEGMGRIVSMDDPEAARRQLDQLAQIDRRYTWIGIADVEGKVVAASQGMLEGVSVAERPWFRRGLNGPAAMDVHAAVLLEKLLPAIGEPRRFVDFAAPLKNAQGAVTGVIGAHFDWRLVQDGLQATKGPGVEMLLVSRDRTVLSGPEGLRGSTLSVGSAIAAGQAASVSLHERWPDGKDYITVVIPSVTYADMPSFGWSIIVRADTDAVLDPTRTITRTFWSILGAGMLVALGLLYLLATWVATPLRRLAGTAEHLASGRSDTPPYDETRYEEASRLSAALVRIQSQSVRPYQPAGVATRKEP
ncbi:cache domain-containing protein [Microvirga solisilvae]|uniref:cache domain-containing protein n=1 Tax=Microvirga solisilvae TaxID=2919498 RepID=UPI001FAEDEC8|nr:cache domain-containing protein [Microvirga solisilvae]